MEGNSQYKERKRMKKMANLLILTTGRECGDFFERHMTKLLKSISVGVCSATHFLRKILFKEKYDTI